MRIICCCMQFKLNVHIFVFFHTEYTATRDMRGMGTMRKEIEGDSRVDRQSANVTGIAAIQKETTT